MTLTNRLKGIKKNFKNVAFIGPNPYLFLQHMPSNYQVEKFYFCEQAEASVQKSHDIITQKIESGFYDQTKTNLPEQMIPTVINEESEWSEKFKDGELDLIVSNMNLHWVNNLEATFRSFNDSLEPDGVFMASAFGGDTLQELRICFNLAESERDGGVSPCISPMLSVTAMGNLFARCKFTMPTIDITRTTCEFTSSYALFDYLRMLGEQSAMHEGQRPKSPETFLAVASLMQTLFNLQTSPPNKESGVHVDLLKDWYGLDNSLSHPLAETSEQQPRPPNIVSTFDMVHLIGWKYHPNQEEAKERGSAQFSLKQVVSEMNEENVDNEDQQIKYGVLIDDGDKVIEE